MISNLTVAARRVLADRTEFVLEFEPSPTDELQVVHLMEDIRRTLG